MAAQKRKKLLTEIFGFFEPLLTENPTNQDSELFLILPDHMKDCWKIFQKVGTRRNYFCLKMISKLAPQ